MIDQLTTSTLCSIADAYTSSARSIPPWVCDALIAATLDPMMPPSMVRRVSEVLRNAERFDCEAA
jgi:hypothetical protein